MTELSPGTVLNQKFAVNRLIAEGGMSKIYLGHPLQGAALVAIKELRESASSADQVEDLHQFHAEFRILQSLRHPSLPRALEFFEENGRHYLVEEYVPGETLEARIQSSGRLSSSDAVALALSLLDVLEYLHKRRIIYRDLKPSNIVLGRDNNVRLIDFGAARVWREGAPRDTVPLGTPGFASPEHYGRAQTDARSDIYSIGALLHYMLTGQDPQEGQPWTFEPPHEIAENIPITLGKITMMALEVDPERRFQHVAAMRTALRDLGLTNGRLGIGATRLTTLRRRLQYAQPQDYYRVLETLGVGLFGMFFFAVSIPAWFANVPLPHPLVGMWLTAYAFVHPYTNWKRFRSLQVEIFAEGIRITNEDGVHDMLWQDVQKLKLTTPGVVTAHSADVYLQNNVQIHFDGVWPGFKEVKDAIIDGANLKERPPGVPWIYHVDMNEKIYERVS